MTQPELQLNTKIMGSWLDSDDGGGRSVVEWLRPQAPECNVMWAQRGVKGDRMWPKMHSTVNTGQVS